MFTREALAPLARCVYFPVRHHSPACAFNVVELIRTRRPELILIEGPADLDRLLPKLASSDLEPPFAILTFSKAEKRNALMWPFCDFSPELAAIRAAAAIEIPVHFIDWPSNAERHKETEGKDSGNQSAQKERQVDVYGELARRNGYRDFSEFELDRFEALFGKLDEHAAAMTQLGDGIRNSDSSSDRQNDLREAYMADRALHWIDAGGTAPEKTLVVCGAFHVAALRDGLAEPACLDLIQPGPPLEATIIPYSMLRLSQYTGYGAGVNAPEYYQAIWDNKGDRFEAARRMLLAIMKALGEKGFQAALSDVIDAEQVLRNLAALRDRTAPGLTEIIEAAHACLAHGRVSRLDEIIRSVLIGERFGAIRDPDLVTPLVQEFRDMLNPLRNRALRGKGAIVRIVLLGGDMAQPKNLQLDLANESEEALSIYLHRLAVSGIPFAELEKPAHESGTTRETWSYKYSQEVEVSLAERSALGENIRQVAETLLKRSLAEVTDIAKASHFALEVSYCRVEELFPDALDACRRLYATESDFLKLARALTMLKNVIDSAPVTGLEKDPFLEIADHISRQCVMSLPQAASCDDEAAEKIMVSLSAAYGCTCDLELYSELWNETLRAVLFSTAANPRICGAAGNILRLHQALSSEEIIATLRHWLSPAVSPEAAAAFINGFLTWSAGELVSDDQVVAALQEYVRALSVGAFVRALVPMRQGFSQLTAAEERYFRRRLARIQEPAGAPSSIAAPETGEYLPAAFISAHHAWIDELGLEADRP